MAPHPVFKAGNTALITGAASGIGLAVAKLCRKHGMKLALVDKNTDALSQTRSIFEKDEAKTETYTMDVSQPNEWKNLRSNVESSFNQVDFLMLNAAIGLKGEWDDMMYFQKVSCSLHEYDSIYSSKMFPILLVVRCTHSTPRSSLPTSAVSPWALQPFFPSFAHHPRPSR